MTKHSYDKEFKEQAVQYYLDNWNLKADNHAKGVWLLAFLAKK